MERRAKNRRERQTLTALIAERLAEIGAGRLPPLARELISDDVAAACAYVIRRRLSAPYVSRMLARALAADAANQNGEGIKGEDESSPLTSQRERDFLQKVPIRVAGLLTDPPNNRNGTIISGPDELPPGKGAANTRHPRVNLGRPRLPGGLAATLAALSPRLRSQAVALILSAHVQGVDIGKLTASGEQLRRIGVLLNQSLRAAHAGSVNLQALQDAIVLINSLRP